MKDLLGDRIKDNYENRTKQQLPRRSYVVMRLDGRSFSNYTKKLDKPFDFGLIEDMTRTTEFLCKNIAGAKFAYTQSDEISILITDFDKLGTQAFFDYEIQKMCSVSAAMATAAFNKARVQRYLNSCENKDLSSFKFAEFDCRVYSVSDPAEVMNSFIWRQQDAVRNSISQVAYSLYSHKELNGKSSNEKQEMIFQKGINWNNYPSICKRGTLVTKEEYEFTNEYGTHMRTKWVGDGAPNLRKHLPSLIPSFEPLS